MLKEMSYNLQFYFIKYKIDYNNIDDIQAEEIQIKSMKNRKEKGY